MRKGKNASLLRFWASGFAPGILRLTRARFLELTRPLALALLFRAKLQCDRPMIHTQAESSSHPRISAPACLRANLQQLLLYSCVCRLHVSPVRLLSGTFSAQGAFVPKKTGWPLTQTHSSGIGQLNIFISTEHTILSQLDRFHVSWKPKTFAVEVNIFGHDMHVWPSPDILASRTMEGQRRMALERALHHCDPMQLRELYGLAVLGVPAPVVKLCLFSLIIGAANVVEVLLGLGDLL